MSNRVARTKVAAHVHAETIPDAIRPGLTLREALLNSSALFGENPVYRAWTAVRTIMNALKNNPIPEHRVRVLRSRYIDTAYQQLPTTNND